MSEFLFKLEDDVEYIGDLENNLRHGYGTCIDTSEGEDIYEGEWKDDKMHGRGKLISSTQGTFEGTFENGELILGKWIDLEDKVYEGSFKNFIKHGKGRLTRPDTSYNEGNWDLGKPVGIHTIFNPKRLEKNMATEDVTYLAEVNDKNEFKELPLDEQ